MLDCSNTDTKINLTTLKDNFLILLLSIRFPRKWWGSIIRYLVNNNFFLIIILIKSIIDLFAVIRSQNQFPNENGHFNSLRLTGTENLFSTSQYRMTKKSTHHQVNVLLQKEVHESAIFGHCALTF